MALSHRLEIRIDEERLELLRQTARRWKSTIGAVIREAIDLQLRRQQLDQKLKAVDALAALAAPVASPARMKQQILKGYLCDDKGVHRRKRADVRRRRS